MSRSVNTTRGSSKSVSSQSIRNNASPLLGRAGIPNSKIIQSPLNSRKSDPALSQARRDRQSHKSITGRPQSPTLSRSRAYSLDSSVEQRRSTLPKIPSNSNLINQSSSSLNTGLWKTDDATLVYVQPYTGTGSLVLPSTPPHSQIISTTPIYTHADNYSSTQYQSVRTKPRTSLGVSSILPNSYSLPASNATGPVKKSRLAADMDKLRITDDTSLTKSDSIVLNTHPVGLRNLGNTVSGDTNLLYMRCIFSAT